MKFKGEVTVTVAPHKFPYPTNFYQINDRLKCVCRSRALVMLSTTAGACEFLVKKKQPTNTSVYLKKSLSVISSFLKLIKITPFIEDSFLVGGYS